MLAGAGLTGTEALKASASLGNATLCLLLPGAKLTWTMQVWASPAALSFPGCHHILATLTLRGSSPPNLLH